MIHSERSSDCSLKGNGYSYGSTTYSDEKYRFYRSKLALPIHLRSSYCAEFFSVHVLEKCEKFASLSVDEHWNWAKEQRMCFKCLEVRHRKSKCKARGCSVRDCAKPHHRLLHSEIRMHAHETSRYGAPGSNVIGRDGSNRF